MSSLNIMTTFLSTMKLRYKILLGVAAPVVTYITYYRLRERYRGPFNSYTTSDRAIDGLDLSNKYAIVTGSNTGIGKETVKILYRQGCHVIMACRNINKAEQAKQEILDQSDTDTDTDTTNGSITVLELDLSSLQSVREFAVNFSNEYQQLHYLINNAGVVLPKFILSADGYEQQFAVNHLGHFYLTRLLMQIIIASKGRVINVSSSAHQETKFKTFEAMLSRSEQNNSGPLEQYYSPMRNYGISKTANILFSRQLAKRYAEHGVTACSLHPGGILATELGRHIKIGVSSILTTLGLFTSLPFVMDNMKSISQGAATTLRCVSLSDQQLQNGEFYLNCQTWQQRGGGLYGAAKKSLTQTGVARQSIEERLWLLSEKLVTQKGFELSL